MSFILAALAELEDDDPHDDLAALAELEDDPDPELHPVPVSRVAGCQMSSVCAAVPERGAVAGAGQ